MIGLVLILLTYSLLAGWLFRKNLVMAGSSKIVSVYYDGMTKIQSTDLDTVGEVLIKMNVNIGEGDIVEPKQNTIISTGFFNINIYRARNVVLIDGNKTYNIKTALQNPKLIAEQAGVVVYPEDLYDTTTITNLIATKTLGQEITIKRSKSINLIIDNTDNIKMHTQARDVKEFLTEKNLTINAENNVDPSLTAPVTDNMQVAISHIVKEPILPNQIIDEDINDNIWLRLRMCESGNNYQRNSHNGYYGAYQFSLSTWRANGGIGYPHEVAPAIQDQMAKKVQAHRGWYPWPGCSTRLGLL